mmetsp:Transcript_101737/g.294413  ORF Transcript_101737/g.294413 Transcript_101737/m.294413 type:complete len:468 (+) Transcript_101737:96-1499(+)
MLFQPSAHNPKPSRWGASGKMIGGSLLAVLPKGFFSWPSAVEDGSRDEDVSPMAINDEGERKRRREEAISGGSTGFTLISAVRGFACSGGGESVDDNDRPRKRLRGRSKLTAVPNVVDSSPEQIPRKQGSDLLKTLPEDVVAHCLSFLGSAEDRFALQTTCKTFRDISNSDAMLEKVDIFGDVETGKNGIIQETDTPSSAAATLAPFARAGNLEALYMLGVVKCYCYQDLKNGILMLKMASQRGFVRASYTLGIILRDSMPGEAKRFMNLAASTGYLPALQEILPASEMKERFGEPDAAELRRHLDPMCLVGLLLRDYVGSAELRGLNTSHCWNPLCGRWAYKTSNKHRSVTRMRGSLAVYDLDGEAEPTIDRTAVPPRRERSIVGLVDGIHDMDGERGPCLPRSSACMTHSCKAIQALAWEQGNVRVDRVSRMKMCSRCCRAKYCSKLCQMYDWRSSQHKMECQFL